MSHRRSSHLIAAALAGLLLLGAAMASAYGLASAASSPPAGNPLDTLTVDPSASAVQSKITLSAGTTYTLVVSGTATQTNPPTLASPGPAAVFSNDALYCFAAAGSGMGCNPSFMQLSNMLIIGIGTPTGAINTFPQQSVPYNASHMYTVQFLAGHTGPLAAVNPQCTGTNEGVVEGLLTCSGSLTIAIYGPASTTLAIKVLVSGPPTNRRETIAASLAARAMITVPMFEASAFGKKQGGSASGVVMHTDTTRVPGVSGVFHESLTATIGGSAYVELSAGSGLRVYLPFTITMSTPLGGSCPRGTHGFVVATRTEVQFSANCHHRKIEYFDKQADHDLLVSIANASG